jgi:hypothetical protein
MPITYANDGAGFGSFSVEFLDSFFYIFLLLQKDLLRFISLLLSGRTAMVKWSVGIFKFYLKNFNEAHYMRSIAQFHPLYVFTIQVIKNGFF